MGFVIGHLDEVIEKFKVIDNLFGIVMACLIIGLFLLLYYRWVEKLLFKPFRLVLQFCAISFLIVGLVGVIFVGGFHVIDKMSGVETLKQTSPDITSLKKTENHETAKTETPKQTPLTEKTDGEIDFEALLKNLGEITLGEITNEENQKTETQIPLEITVSEIKPAERIKKIYVSTLSFNDLVKFANKGNTDAQVRLAKDYNYRPGYGNRKKAFELFTKVAEKENPDAQYQLGWIYETGNEYIKSNKQKSDEWYAKAFKNYNKLANNGDPDAQYELGWMYEFAMGGVQSNKQKSNEWYAKAFENYSKLANNGDPDAQYQLGWMYELEVYVKKNYKKAFEYYSKAAESGHIDAQMRLEYMYYNGAVKTDYKKAYMWSYISKLHGYGHKVVVSLRLAKRKLSQSDVRKAEAEAQQKYNEIQKRIKK